MTNSKPFNGIKAYDFFVTKFNGYNANHIWSRRFRGKNPLCDAAYGNAAAVDAKDDFFIAGYFSGTPGVGDNRFQTTESIDPFIEKFKEMDGSHIWSKRFSVNDLNSAYGSDVTADNDGNLIVAGYFSGTLDIGGGLLTSTAQKRDLFVVKYTGAFREVQGKQ